MILSGPTLTLGDPNIDAEQQRQWYGPFESTASPGNLYIVNWENGIGQKAVYIWHSSNHAGTSWNLALTISTGSHTFTTSWDGATDTLILIQPGPLAGRNTVFVVNVDTMAYTTTEVSAHLGGVALGDAIAVKNSNGKITLFKAISGTVHAVDWATDGTFGSGYTFTDPAKIYLGEAAPAINQVAGSLDTRYAIYGDTSTAWRVAVIDSTNTVTARAVAGAGGNASLYCGPIFAIAGGSLFVSIGNSVYRSTDLSASSWVSSLTVTATLSATAGWINLVTDGTLLIALYYQLTRQSVSAHPTVDQVLSQTYLGSDAWSAPIVAADFVATPPQGLGGPYAAGAHYQSPTLLSDGTIGMGVNFDYAALCMPFYVQFSAILPLRESANASGHHRPCPAPLQSVNRMEWSNLQRIIDAVRPEPLEETKWRKG